MFVEILERGQRKEENDKVETCYFNGHRRFYCRNKLIIIDFKKKVFE